MKDQIINVKPPEFGSSKTSALLLLWLKKNRPNINWILSIKTKENLKQIFINNNIRFVQTKHLDLATKKVLKSIETGNKIFEIQAIVDEASSGFESITYLFAKDKNELLNLVKILE